MQDHPGAPGTARKRITRTVVPAACGGAAAHQTAPGQEQPLVAPPVTRPDRPCATPQAPGYDVPQASSAWAPVHNRPRAAPSAPVPDRCRPAQTAPGQDRPPVAPPATRPDRPRATPQAPGYDVPLVTVARAPGYGRPCAAQLVPEHHRSHPAPMAPPGHALARAGTYVPITTAPLPARVSRLLQERLSRITATPNTRTHPQPRRHTRNNRTPSSQDPTYPQSRRLNRHSRASGNPRPPVATGGLQGGYAPATRPTYPHPPAPSTTHPVHPPITAPTAARRSPPTAANVHPATQAPTRPSPTTTCTGVSRQHHSRAPPISTHRKSTPVRPYPSPRGRGLG